MTRAAPYLGPANPSGEPDPLAEALRSCRVGFVYCGFISLTLNVLALTVPLYMLQIYDRVVTSRNLDTLLMLTIIAIFALMLFSVLDYVRARVNMILGESVARKLSVPVLRSAVSNALRAKGGALSGQPIRDLNDLRVFITTGPVSAPMDAVSAPIFLGVLFMLHPTYGFVASIAAVLLIGMGLAMEFIAQRPMAEAQEHMLRANVEAGSVVRGAELIEGMGMLRSIERRWARSHAHAMHLIWNGTNAAKVISAFTKGLRMTVQVTMLAAGAMLVIDHQVSPGSMIAATIIMGRLLLPFEHLIDGWRQWKHASAAFSRLQNLLGEREGTRQMTQVPAAEGRLVVDRLGFVPPGSDRPILRGISFSLAPGEALGVVGPSAAGKSTLARLMVGLWPPTAGGVFLDGQNVYLWERESFGEHVGYVPQNCALLDGTIRENISRFQDVDPSAVIDAARRADVHEMIGRLPQGYDTMVGEAGYVLSGGQRQRIALARALFGQPKLLVLDEPNSNLDGAGEQALLAAIAEAKRGGVTIILIAHRPAVMSAVDKLLVLKDGLIERYGPRADVMRAITAGSARGPVKVESSRVVR